MKRPYTRRDLYEEYYDVAPVPKRGKFNVPGTPDADEWMYEPEIVWRADEPESCCGPELTDSPTLFSEEMVPKEVKPKVLKTKMERSREASVKALTGEDRWIAQVRAKTNQLEYSRRFLLRMVGSEAQIKYHTKREEQLRGELHNMLDTF